MGKRVYILYDWRAASFDTENANVFVIDDSLEEAKISASQYEAVSSCHSYAVQGNELIDEQWEFNWSETSGFEYPDEDYWYRDTFYDHKRLTKSKLKMKNQKQKGKT